MIAFTIIFIEKLISKPKFTTNRPSQETKYHLSKFTAGKASNTEKIAHPKVGGPFCFLFILSLNSIALDHSFAALRVLTL